MAETSLPELQKRLDLLQSIPPVPEEGTTAGDLYALDVGHLLGQNQRLRAALEAAVEHMEELEEAWRRGAIHEIDGMGGIRSNRNVECARQAQAALKESYV